MLFKTIIARFLLILFSAGTLVGSPVAGEVALPAPCNAYLDNLEKVLTHLSQEDFNKCDIYEQIIISAESWTDYVQRFREHTGLEALPVLLFEMFENESKMNYARAFVGADVALSHVGQIFTKLDDLDRAKFYTSLLIDWRNDLLVKTGSPDVFTSRLAQSYDRSYDSYGNFTKMNKDQVIKCAIRFDSFMLPLREFLDSKTFARCVRHQLY